MMSSALKSRASSSFIVLISEFFPVATCWRIRNDRDYAYSREHQRLRDVVGHRLSAACWKITPEKGWFQAFGRDLNEVDAATPGTGEAQPRISASYEQ